MPFCTKSAATALVSPIDRGLASRRRRSGWAMPLIEPATEAMLMMLTRRCPSARAASSIFGSARLDRHVHRAHVEVEAEVPVLRRAVEDRAVVHVAGAVEQDVERRQLVDQRARSRRRRARRACASMTLATPAKRFEQLRLDVGGVAPCAPSRAIASAVALADALSGGGDQCRLACQVVHSPTVPFVLPLAGGSRGIPPTPEDIHHSLTASLGIGKTT